jgi:hypothetical protein
MPNLEVIEIDGKKYYTQAWGEGNLAVFREPTDFPLVVVRHETRFGEHYGEWTIVGEPPCHVKAELGKMLRELFEPHASLPMAIAAAEKGLQILAHNAQGGEAVIPAESPKVAFESPTNGKVYEMDVLMIMWRSIAIEQEDVATVFRLCHEVVIQLDEPDSVIKTIEPLAQQVMRQWREAGDVGAAHKG